MATTTRDKRIVTVSVTHAEMMALVGTPARNQGYIDFDPTSIQIYETDPETGAFEIQFENDVPVV